MITLYDAGLRVDGEYDTLAVAIEALQAAWSGYDCTVRYDPDWKKIEIFNRFGNRVEYYFIQEN